ncbi:hypothetical protein [Virgibacillus sp. CBA3643]|uniref:hypothetical protein n=1 Tax=Virgibacillus sp. CBA3643 TaxID=2942278 RepID=UPI0035A3CAB5
MVTAKQVQSVLGKQGKEEQIDALIPLVYGYIKSYCNIEEVPEEYDINAIKMIEYQLNTKSGITSESLSRHSVSYSTDYPADVLKGLRRRLRW